MNLVALNLSRLARLNRETRTIRIEAIRAVSLAHQIERDWDEIAREYVEGVVRNERPNVARFKGK